MAQALEAIMRAGADPTVSVVVPTYNAAPFLREALDSIRDQTWHDFEVIIVDDGSTDASPAIIQRFTASDPRFRYVRQDNAGVAAAINKGVSLARGQWIARMDADDVAHPDRLRLQLEFLRRHSNVDMVSACYERFPAPARLARVTHPESHAMISLLLVFCCPICHPLVMAHRKVFDTCSYIPGQVAEDHELWCRVVERFVIANMAATLLRYRVHPQSETARKLRRIRWATYKNGLRHLWRHRTTIASVSFAEIQHASGRYPHLNWSAAKLALTLAKGFHWMTAR